ncbi:bifunctional epoxide hydrolase 2 [Osmerus eperlanus]|uniref:bifunctional epoxide hydrolase 2 n=1 Tax=Osmerus eperlanus TaxID=29151 RepID=UPI002E11209D
MAGRKVVLFNQWGVVLTPSPDLAFDKYEDSHQLPRGFLGKVASRDGSAMVRAENAKLTLSQMIPEFDAECVKEAGDQGVALPGGFSVRGLFDELRETLTINTPVLHTADTLRQHGVLTGVLANQWVDDCASGSNLARALSLIGGHFDLLQQSCRCGFRVPEPSMFTSALQVLDVQPSQAVWVDEDEEGVKAAEGVGMKAVLVKDLAGALKQLSDFTGVQVLTEDSLPATCHPEQVSHGYVTIKPGVQIHYVEKGVGPPVLLFHGFPESWYSWRYQVPALADAGFRVLALDMKGYGASSAPPDIKEYSQEELCKDLVVFLDKMGIPQVTLIGHDWGGSLVWSMAQCHPERVRAVASLNTPLFPVDPASPPMERLKAMPIFDYQIYFQTPGVAEAELEKDLERTFKIFFFGSRDKTGGGGLSTAGVCARGGLFVGVPEEVPRSSILSEDALQFYVTEYKKNGFRGPLNWYRNVEKNWAWLCSRPRTQLLMPALMVTTGKDPVLLPVFSKGMENMIPNLTRGHIEECGHWTQIEKPAQLNKILISWLQDTLGKTGITMTPRL